MAPTVCTHCLHRLPLDPLLDDDFRMALHPDGLRHGFASHHVEPSIFATVLKPTCLPPCVFFFSSMLNTSFKLGPCAEFCV